MPFGFGGLNSHLGNLGGQQHFTSAPSQKQQKAKNFQQDPAVERPLEVSLEDLLKGCTKKMKLSRNVYDPSSGQTKREEKIMQIQVKPGWKSGTKIRFEKEGDRKPNSIPADVVFVIKDKPHPLFKRENQDLIYTAKISLRDALCGCSVIVKNLEGKAFEVKCNQVNPTTVRKIPEQGLPYPKDSSKRGDLLVKFDIKFPNDLSDSIKSTLRNCLPA